MKSLFFVCYFKISQLIIIGRRRSGSSSSSSNSSKNKKLPGLEFWVSEVRGMEHHTWKCEICLKQNKKWTDSVSKSVNIHVPVKSLQSNDFWGFNKASYCDSQIIYSKISILQPPLGLFKSGLRDHFWTVPKVVSNQRYIWCGKWRKE